MNLWQCFPFMTNASIKLNTPVKTFCFFILYMESFKLNSSFNSMIRFLRCPIKVNWEFIIALSRMNFGKRIFKSVLSVHLKLHLFGISSLWLIAKQQGPDSPLQNSKKYVIICYIVISFKGNVSICFALNPQIYLTSHVSDVVERWNVSCWS